jgi:FkbM family methyltransferase
MKQEILDLWYKNNDVHDFLHRHKLSNESLIVDVGSYKGSWLHHMNKLYGCRCIGVEPVAEFVKESVKLEFNNDCQIHHFGLTTDDLLEDYINIDEDASSMFKIQGLETGRKIDLKNAKDFFLSIGDRIDVLQINCEGMEYSLIPFMIDNDLFKNVNFVQIQFHDISESSNRAMHHCIDIIEKNGFKTKFEYPFVWYGAEKVSK